MLVLEEMLVGAIDVAKAVYDIEVELLMLEDTLFIKLDVVDAISNVVIELLDHADVPKA